MSKEWCKETLVIDKIMQWLLGVFFAAGHVSTFIFAILHALHTGHRALVALPVFLLVALLTGLPILFSLL